MFYNSQTIFYIGLSSSEINIFIYLVSKNNNYHPSVGEIVKTLGIAKVTVVKSLKYLVEKKMIKKIRHATPVLATHYEINPASIWGKLPFICNKKIENAIDITLRKDNNLLF